MQTSSQIESLLKRDRMVVVSGVVAVVAIAWAYTIYVAQSNAYTWMKTRIGFENLPAQIGSGSYQSATP